MDRRVGVILRLAGLLLALGFAGDLAADQRASRQAQLDRACEVARQIRLTPLRQASIRKCIREAGKARSDCERLHGNYGERAGNRPALFYDLPECVRAFEFQRSYRRAD
jgi:hypothetical protein